MNNSQSDDIIMLIKRIVLGQRIKRIACICALMVMFSNTTAMKSSGKAKSLWILLVQITKHKKSLTEGFQ